MSMHKCLLAFGLLSLVFVPASGCSSNGGSSEPGAGTIACAPARDIAAEANGGVTLAVTRSGGSEGAVTVAYATAEDTDNSPPATSGDDYDPADGTLSWAHGDADDKSITVTVHDDGAEEDAEWFQVALSEPGGGAVLGERSSAAVQIVDGAGPSVRLMPDNVSYGAESDYLVRLRARVEGLATGSARVAVHTRDGTATGGEDFTAFGGDEYVLEFVSGRDVEQWIDIPIVQDDLVEGDETFEVLLADPEGVVLGDPSSLTITIFDDDAPQEGIIEFTGEGPHTGFAVGTARVEVLRHGGSSGAVTVDCATIEGGSAEAGVDYLASSGTLSWADGEEGIQAFEVPIIDDVLVEQMESIILELSNATGGAHIGSFRTEYLFVHDKFKIEPEPVLVPGDTGFDQDIVTDPSVLMTPAGSFEMYYVGATDGGESGIGRAVSEDGLAWTRQPATPLQGLPQTACSPTVVLLEGSYHMWYHPTAAKESIAYATSADGVNWAVENNGDPVTCEHTSTWHATPEHPCVLYDRGLWKMWYSGVAGIRAPEIGYATSPDGIHWTEYEDNPVYSDGGLGTYEGSMQPTVIKDGDTYRMWMATRKNFGSVIYAASADGIAWEADPEDSKDVFSYFDIGGRIEEPSALRIGEGFYVYFADHNTSYHPDTIGLAINPSP